MAGGGNIYDQSSQALGAATANAASPAAFGARVSANMNPFAEQVTNRTLNNMERNRQMATNTMDAQASAAGAFGGSRHGVANSLTNAEYARAFADQEAQLNYGNFNNAQNLATQQGQQLQSLAGQAFDMGNTIGDRQLRDGLLQQSMNQSLIDAGRAQFAGYTGAPGQSLQYPLAAISSVPHGQTTTTEQNPGLLNYLSLGFGLL